MSLRLAALGVGGAALAGAAVGLSPFSWAGDVKEKIGTGLYKNVVWQGLTPKDRVPDAASLAVSTLQQQFRNPLGLAAGCDHNAEAVEGFTAMGFGFVEVGTVTPAQQEGNKKPRVFRLEEDRGVINRVGYANDGVEVVGARLQQLRAAGFKGKIGVNVGFQKGGETVAADYIAAVKACAPHVDYIVINAAQLYHPPIPAFKNVRGQHRELECVLKTVMAYRNIAHPSVPMLVKIHPDFDDEALRETCRVIEAQFGGLSGSPMRDLSTGTLKKVYQYTGGRVPLVGVGGVMSGQDAYEKVRAGASLVQMYSGLVYEGPYVVPRIKWELAELAKRDGFESVQAAVGADVKLAPADQGQPKASGWRLW